MKSLLMLLAVLFVFSTTACNKAKDEKKDDKANTENADKKEEKSEESAGGAWAPSAQEQYMKACSESAGKDIGKDKAEAYCQCTLDKIMIKYTAEEAGTKLKADEMMDLASACIKELDIKK